MVKKIIFIELIVMMKSNLNQIGLGRKHLKHDMDKATYVREKNLDAIYVCMCKYCSIISSSSHHHSQKRRNRREAQK